MSPRYCPKGQVRGAPDRDHVAIRSKSVEVNPSFCFASVGDQTRVRVEAGGSAGSRNYIWKRPPIVLMRCLQLYKGQWPSCRMIIRVHQTNTSTGCVNTLRQMD
jgi:hypothetical protein